MMSIYPVVDCPGGAALYDLLIEKRGEQRLSTQISSFGNYCGFTEPRFDDWQCVSQYVAMRDGTRLAVDIMHPVSAGVLVEEPLPAIWTHTRYQRASLTREGEVETLAEHWDPWLFQVIAQGYVVLCVDVRGGGASFGVNRGQFPDDESRDAYDLTEWIAEQSWCDGNVGMYGRSYMGITQYFAASEKPPHLKAIFPEMASFDHYGYVYGGGVFRDSSRFNWQLLVGNLDQSIALSWKDDYQGPVAPVDEDKDGELLKSALREHRQNHNWYRLLESCPFRDSAATGTGEVLHETRSPGSRLAAVEDFGVPMYHLAGWYDMFPRDTFLWFANAANPQKLVIGPWFHVDTHGLDTAAEHLRWYDHWLKGVANGVMDEAPIHYWVIDAPVGQEWRSTDVWPLAEEQPTAFYLDAGPSGSVGSVNDGRLGYDMSSGSDTYRVDSTTTTGVTNRWANANGGATGYPDMTANDEKGLTYTTSVLEQPIEVTGHPVVYLWVSTSAEDGDFYAYLEDVQPDGFSQYVTEGVLRASHRALGEAPWNHLGLPYHSGLATDTQPLPDDLVELVFDLHPTSKIFRAGHRIRLTIVGADSDNDRALVYEPPPVVTICRDAKRPSRVVLPVIQS